MTDAHALISEKTRLEKEKVKLENLLLRISYDLEEINKKLYPLLSTPVLDPSGNAATPGSVSNDPSAKSALDIIIKPSSTKKRLRYSVGGEEGDVLLQKYDGKFVETSETEGENIYAKQYINQRIYVLFDGNKNKGSGRQITGLRERVEEYHNEHGSTLSDEEWAKDVIKFKEMIGTCRVKLWRNGTTYSIRLFHEKPKKNIKSSSSEAECWCMEEWCPKNEVLISLTPLIEKLFKIYQKMHPL